MKVGDTPSTILDSRNRSAVIVRRRASVQRYAEEDWLSSSRSLPLQDRNPSSSSFLQLESLRENVTQEGTDPKSKLHPPHDSHALGFHIPNTVSERVSRE
eukprot:scaffold9789_cov54-Attheya_sp.AAC.7